MTFPRRSVAPPFSIRPFRKTDARTVAGMLVKLAAFHGNKAPRKPQDFIAYGLGPRKLTSIWVAVADRRVVGFASTLTTMNFLRGTLTDRMEYFYVDEAFRRNGIGTALTQKVLAEAVRKGCTRFTVGAVPHNKTSNAFYKQCGLTQRRKEHIDYIADAASLKKLARTLKGTKK